jgi:thiol-disulfide isomerase/thioredoxin
MRLLIGVLVVVCAFGGTAVQAQSYAAFGFKPAAELDVPAFSDEGVRDLLATLDRLVAGAVTANQQPAEVFWQFGRRLQMGRMSSTQEALILGHLADIARTRPDLASAAGATRRVIEHLTVGKPAPDAAGIDLAGRPFRLSEYRGKVVALVFSAEWCAICRTQAPYERFLLGRYERWPFALLGVHAGSARGDALKAFQSDPLTHRSWWDVPAGDAPSGPIATAWNVIGWPATYLIDGSGIIRFIDVRDEDLLKAVRQLVDEQVALNDKSQRVK